MTILILPFTWLHSTPKPTCWASPVEARPGQGPGWTVYRVESAGCKTVLPWSVRTPWVPPTYQSHIYDNCDECEELLCFSLQLTWHKIFHYKLITTILCSTFICWLHLGHGPHTHGTHKKDKMSDQMSQSCKCKCKNVLHKYFKWGVVLEWHELDHITPQYRVHNFICYLIHRYTHSHSS